MYVKIANRGCMCSTLVLGNIPNRASTKHLAEYIRQAFKEAERNAEDTRDILYDYWSDDHKSVETALADHDVCEYAFVICTTDHEDQEVSEDSFEALGFCGSDVTYNEKNETDVRLWTISVPLLLKNISEVLDKKEKKVA